MKRKKLNEIFDEAKAEELEQFSDELNAPELPDEILASVKGKVYVRTKLKNHKKTAKSVWLRFGAIAACFLLIVSASIALPKPRSESGKITFTESNDQSGQNTQEHPSQGFILNLKEVKPYQPLVNGFSDSVSSVRHELEYVFADKEKYSKITPREKLSVNIGGKMYEGVLRSTEFIADNYFPTHYYSSKDWGETGLIYFNVDENGKLIGFLRSTTCGDEIICSEEECLQIAKDFLSQYVDISQYQIQTEINENDKCYTFRFIKYIDGFETNDMAVLDIDFEGKLNSFSSCMLGRIPIETETSDIDMDKIHLCVKERLDEIYLPVKDKYDKIIYGEGDSYYYLTILKDGKRGISYSINIIFKSQVKTNQNMYTQISERISMVIPLD